VLAWIGGVAVAIGLVLLAVMASAGHRLGVPERLGLAGVGSLVLMGAGVWLHERRGHTEASIVAVGAATVAMFVILAVAAHGATIPAFAAIAGSLFVGGLAVALARRWAGQAIGWLGLLGAVAAPTAAGGPLDATALVLLAIALVCLLAIAVWQRWTWLAFAGLLLAMAQWGWWCAHTTSVPGQLLVLSTFTGLGLAAALVQRLVHRGDAIDPVTVLFVAVNALAAGTLGRLLLGSAGSPVAGDVWLAGIGAVHLALGSMRRLRLGVELRALLLAAGFVLADVAFGLAFSVIDAGTGAHIALVLVRVLLATGDTGVVPVVGTVALAIACLTGGWLAGSRRAPVADVLNGLGLAAIAYLTAQSLHGVALVAAWTAEAVALAQLARRTGPEPWRAEILRGEAVAFLVLALGHVLLVEAPPTVLVDGSPAFGAVALALAALAAGAIRAGLASPRAGAWRPWLLTAGAAVVLYLLSAGIITLFQPVVGAVGQFGSELVDLSVRQQGQVVLSIVWGAIGLAGVVVGLRRRQDIVRNVALGLLLIAVTKVFAYDLSTLTSVYRVASLLRFGVLLLVSAFAYQRLRPGAHRVRR
jgi:hypothetical protein